MAWLEQIGGYWEHLFMNQKVDIIGATDDWDIEGLSIVTHDIVCIKNHRERVLRVWHSWWDMEREKEFVLSAILINMVSIFYDRLASVVENRRLLLLMDMFSS